MTAKRTSGKIRCDIGQPDDRHDGQQLPAAQLP
jgi:hypothetical protein